MRVEKLSGTNRSDGCVLTGFDVGTRRRQSLMLLYIP